MYFINITRFNLKEDLISKEKSNTHWLYSS